MPLICLLMCDIQSVWSMILIPSVSEEQLLPPDGQCSWQQYRIGYDLYFTWTVYYSIYATLTYIYTLSEKVLFEWPYLCSHRCPFSCQWTYNEEGCLYIHALDKCELPADVYICIYCYWCIFCTCVHIWVTCKFGEDEVKEEQNSEELLWTIEKVINDELFASDMNLLMKFKSP